MNKLINVAIIVVAASFVAASASIVASDISNVVHNAKMDKALKRAGEVMKKGGKENEQV